MRTSSRPIVIASRRSRLAQAQTRSIGEALQRLHPGVTIDYCWLESQGDRHQDIPLADAGGKGLFARAIEEALLAGRADVAVHSLKDLPVPDTPGLCLVAIPPRHDVRDCLITPPGGATTIADLPHGAVVGTASPRRAAQLKLLRPDLRIELMRGNVDTRLRKVIEDRAYDAALLAVAGLHRAGLAEYATNVIDPEEILPAASQGALAIQCRRDDHVTLSRCLPLNDPQTATAVHLECSVVAALNGDCRSPIAALAQPHERDGQAGYRLRVRALDPQGRRSIDVDDWAPVEQTTALEKRVVAELLSRGAAELIRDS